MKDPVYIARDHVRAILSKVRQLRPDNTYEQPYGSGMLIWNYGYHRLNSETSKGVLTIEDSAMDQAEMAAFVNELLAEPDYSPVRVLCFNVRNHPDLEQMFRKDDRFTRYEIGNGQVHYWARVTGQLPLF